MLGGWEYKLHYYMEWPGLASMREAGSHGLILGGSQAEEAADAKVLRKEHGGGRMAVVMTGRKRRPVFWSALNGNESIGR